MSFFLSPIKFVFELIGFLISAAFVYGLALIATIAFIAYAITTLEPRYEVETIVNTVHIVEKHEVIKFVEKGPELICMKISGCKIVHDAKTEKEYCPTCIMK